MKTYNNHFYKKQLKQSSDSAQYIVPIINDLFNPTTVIDIGCGVGAWLEIWKHQSNILEVKGVDALFVEKSLLRIDIETEFVEVNLNEKLPKLKKYDLATCLEVAEHLEESRAETFIKDLTNLSDIILFSAAIPGQEGTEHINEQFLSYWVEIFKSNNYSCYDVVRPLIWNVESVAWWFRQNTVLFINNDIPLETNLKAMQSFNCYDLVHKGLLIYKDKKYDKLLNKEIGLKESLKRVNKILFKK